MISLTNYLSYIPQLLNISNLKKYTSKEVITIYIMVNDNRTYIEVTCPHCNNHDGNLFKKINNATMKLSRCNTCNKVYEIRKEKPHKYLIVKYQ